MLNVLKPNRILPTVIALALFALYFQPATAAVINVGNCYLAPNKADQKVCIFVSGSDLVAGLNFYAQIGDGGPDRTVFGLPAGTAAPSITAVDLKTGTIFDSIPDDQTNDGSIPQVVFYSIEIQESGVFVPAQGVLATLTMDSRGYTEGSWDFLLSEILGDSNVFTSLVDVQTVIQNGTIGIAIDGDCTLDGRVDEADATIVAANWGASGGGLGWTEGDLSGDGAVDIDDAMIIAQNWLQVVTPAVAVAVPEPTTAALFVLFLLAGVASLRFGRELR